ncbi:ROK family transcriptional regulator [Bacillus sp. FSL K6-3431]|uniref:ROK family transcriptional regulator n=1 Tax=Bacillus sp. FSL K6-3431 TaxID=2921500 RepID=UPI0030FB3430
MKKGSFQWMESLNRSIVLNKIRVGGPISRAEIARDTKLTPPTVSKLVSELLSSELIMESEIGESLGGRKPTMLIINSDRFFVIGLDIGTKSVRGTLTNLTGELIEHNHCPIPKLITNDTLVILIKNVISQLISAHEDIEVIGIGVGMHGAVDVDNGIALYAPMLNLKNVMLKSELELAFDLPVIVDNDVRAMAFGEYWYAHGESNENMVTVNLGHGVGAGIISNGKLFHGEHDLAGEIGHMTVDLSGKQCSCGNIGCWQTLVSGPAIADEAKLALARGRISILENKDLEGKTVYDAAVAGDLLAIEILSKTGEYIGIGLTNLIHILNPEKIIIGGGVSGASKFILQNIKEAIKNRGLTEQARSTEIFCSNRGPYSTAMGAASLMLANVFLEN